MIGSIIESIKMAFAIADEPDDIPATAAKVVKTEPGPVDPVNEDKPRRIMTLDEKLAAANKAQGFL